MNWLGIDIKTIKDGMDKKKFCFAVEGWWQFLASGVRGYRACYYGYNDIKDKGLSLPIQWYDRLMLCILCDLHASDLHRQPETLIT